MRRLLFYLLPILFVVLSIGFCGDYVIKMARLKNVQIGTAGDVTRSEYEDKTNGYYTITYDLDGGTIEVENPTKYNLFTENFTLNNPVKTNYDFIGWTGPNLTEPKINVTICKGSSGDLEFKANYKLNHLDSPIITLNDNILSWTPVNLADKYYICVGSDVDDIITTDCSINLLDYVDVLTIPVAPLTVRAYNSTDNVISSASNTLTFRYEPVDDSFNYTCPVTIHIDYRNTLEVDENTFEIINKPDNGSVIGYINLSFTINNIKHIFNHQLIYDSKVSVLYLPEKSADEYAETFCSLLSTSDCTFLFGDNYIDIYRVICVKLSEYLNSNGLPAVGNIFNIDISGHKPALRVNNQIILANSLIFNFVFDTLSVVSYAPPY